MFTRQVARTRCYQQTLNLQRHVNSLCKSSYYHLRALRHIRASLPEDICLSLGTALIQYKLDYSNSVLYGTSVSNLHKLQMVQNALARTITRSPRSVPTSQLLSNLHWLPIHKRTNFKVAILTYKVLSTQQPAYLNQMAIKPTLQQTDAILEVFDNHRVVFCALEQLSCIEMYLYCRPTRNLFNVGCIQSIWQSAVLWIVPEDKCPQL